MERKSLTAGMEKKARACKTFTVGTSVDGYSVYVVKDTHGAQVIAAKDNEKLISMDMSNIFAINLGLKVLHKGITAYDDWYKVSDNIVSILAAAGGMYRHLVKENG